MFGFVSWVVFVSSVRGSALSCALPVGRWIVLDRRAPAAPKVRLSQPKRKPVDAWTFVHGQNPIGISDCLLIIAAHLNGAKDLLSSTSRALMPVPV